MPSPVPNPARAGHYVHLATGNVNFYCNCGARAQTATLRHVAAHANEYAILNPIEIKQWQEKKLTFQPVAPAAPDAVQKTDTTQPETPNAQPPQQSA